MRVTRTTTLALALLMVAGCAEIDRSGASGPTTSVVAGTEPTTTVAEQVDLPTVTVHKTESCECCGQYEAYLEARGVEVAVILHDDVAPLKDELGVPDDQRSCHTNEVGGYVAEGHVPVEALEALLAEAPDVDGVALAGMPSGSPGMPGEQEEPFVVTTIADGDVTGELGRF